MKSISKFLLPLLALVLFAAACGSDSDSATTTGNTEAPAEAEAEAEAPGTVVDVAVGSGSFPTLVAALTEADLVDTLSGDGPFTVLAPTEDAFAAALEALGLTAEELLASEDLASILTYHVIPTEALAADVVALDGSDVDTVNGASVAVSVVDGSVMINDATVTQTDIAASNGVIHVIDTVLLPPA